jgi:hypothetical protein
MRRVGSGEVQGQSEAAVGISDRLSVFPRRQKNKTEKKKRHNKTSKTQRTQRGSHALPIPSRPDPFKHKARPDTMGNEQTLPSVSQERRGDRGPLSAMYEGNHQTETPSSSSPLTSPVVVRPLPAPTPALKRTRSALFCRRKAPEPVDPAQLFPNVKKKKEKKKRWGSCLTRRKTKKTTTGNHDEDPGGTRT